MVEFVSNDIKDVLIFSGVDVRFEDQVDRSLKGKAADAAFAQLKESYNTYKQNLNPSYGKFLAKYERGRTVLEGPAVLDGIRPKIADKLTELATKRIKNKESNFYAITRFFQRLGSVFQGRGFRTKGEWGIELANRIRKIDTVAYRQQIPEFINNRTHANYHYDSMMAKINSLSDDAFKSIVVDAMYYKDEFWFGEKAKYKICNSLTPEKRNILISCMLQGAFWHTKIFNFVEGADTKQIQDFITDDIVHRFISDAKETGKSVMSNSKTYQHNGWFRDFYQSLMEKGIQHLLKEPNIALRYSKISDFIKKVYVADLVKQNAMILSAAEINDLNANLNLGFMFEPAK